MPQRRQTGSLTFLANRPLFFALQDELQRFDEHNDVSCSVSNRDLLASSCVKRESWLLP